MDDRERELDESVDDLAETLEAVRDELRNPPEGPLGLPRPPTPGEFIRFTEQYTIPALISILETSIRTLELLAAALRVADGRPLDGPSDGRRGADDPRADRIASASRRTLRALDDALADLQSAAAGGEPQNPELQRLLSEARDLRAEVDDRLADATADPTDRPGEPGLGPESGPRSGPEPVNIEVKGGDDEAEDGEDDGDDPGERDVGVDVDSELESIKRELDEPREELDGESRSDTGLEDASDDDGVGVDDTAGSDESDPDDDSETPN